MEIIKYIFTFIPPSIKVGDEILEFQMFINHAHYDFRICYCNDETFNFLFENIENDEDLLNALKMMREELKTNGHLKDEYLEEDGYTKEKYLKL